jgi:hypothetical protein
MSELIVVFVRHCQSSRWKIRLGPLLERKAHVRSRSQSGGKIPTGNMSIKSKTRMVCYSRRAIGWPRRSSAQCDDSRCGVCMLHPTTPSASGAAQFVQLAFHPDMQSNLCWAVASLSASHDCAITMTDFPCLLIAVLRNCFFC